MKVGTIINNGYASKDNPIKYGMYIGGNKVLCFQNGKAKIVTYNDINKDPWFKDIGFIDIKAEIQKAMEEQQ